MKVTSVPQTRAHPGLVRQELGAEPLGQNKLHYFKVAILRPKNYKSAMFQTTVYINEGITLGISSH